MHGIKRSCLDLRNTGTCGNIAPVVRVAFTWRDTTRSHLDVCLLHGLHVYILYLDCTAPLGRPWYTARCPHASVSIVCMYRRHWVYKRSWFNHACDGSSEYMSLSLWFLVVKNCTWTPINQRLSGLSKSIMKRTAVIFRLSFDKGCLVIQSACIITLSWLPEKTLARPFTGCSRSHPSAVNAHLTSAYKV